MVRESRGGITFFVEIRRRTPNDRVAMVSVPADEENVRRLKERPVLLKALTSFSKSLQAPLLFFRFYQSSVRYVVKGKRYETSLENFERGIEGPSLELLLRGSWEVKEGKGVPLVDSAGAYSKMHDAMKVWSPESWCVDVDCFTERGIVEVKRVGEKLTYNQLVLKRLVEKVGWRYEVVYVFGSV